jgi:tRNA-splicing ligase RtcB
MARIKVEKLSNYKWRIPKRAVPGMKVDGIFYASERLYRDIQNDNSLLQLANVATLPGIVKYSIAMPDIHWGYGFPIGGVAAVNPEIGGVITPGGIGFDINCLDGESRILHRDGYYLRIADMEPSWRKADIICHEFSENQRKHTQIVNYMKLRPEKPIYLLRTESGDEITATSDHPFWTPNGMVELGKLKPGDKVALLPFEGVPYEEPSNEVIVDEESIISTMNLLGKSETSKIQVLNHLRKLGILPIRYNSPQLPSLIRILGYLFGDGTIYFSRSGKGITWFWGEPEDLEEIREDIEAIGFTPSRIYDRVRDHRIKTLYGVREFERLEHSFKVVSSSFAALLVSLGAPVGAKASQDYRVPEWLKEAPLWQKRLFLAAHFGAELNKPKTLTGHGYNFYMPMLSLNKHQGHIESGVEFLSDIADLLLNFDVHCTKISKRLEYINDDSVRSYRLRLILSGQTEDLINLWGKIGFEYNRKRRFLANVAVQYLKRKRKLLELRAGTAKEAERMFLEGVSAREILDRLEGDFIDKRFLERSIYKERATDPRVPKDFPTFKEYLEEATAGLGESGMVWERITSIEPIPFDDYVYDFTVAHEDHNFVANGFVVSNCGVRLLRTNLTYGDVKGRIRDLVNALFERIPTGVGSTGSIRLSEAEMRNVLKRGARWATDNGYGKPEDLLYTEENGCLEFADPSAPSRRAYQRGRNQLGTLGSGNHFLEVQIVEKVYDARAAKVLGLEEGMITVMIHTGSRGFGHQVCDDTIKAWARVPQKYGISIPDRQLVCAPVNSPEGQRYLAAMACAANYAWANRQCLMHWTRQVFQRFFGMSDSELGMDLVYDVAHNIAKIEEHEVDGKRITLCIHRKGATRAFPPGHPDVPEKYRSIGQPVIIPGDMGTHSYVLLGTKLAMEEAFGTTCHGAGRVLSRRQAIRTARGRNIQKELEDQDIYVRSAGRETLAEEMPEAYKDVDEVVNTAHGAGISKRVARMRPLGVIKG